MKKISIWRKTASIFVSFSMLLNGFSPFVSAVYSEDLTPTPETVNNEHTVNNTQQEAETNGLDLTTPTVTPTSEAPVIIEIPIEIPSAEILPPVNPVPTPTPVTEIEKECLNGQEIVSTTNDNWNIDLTNGTAETTEKVKLGVKYLFPQENRVSITFKCLPKDEALRTGLKIQQLKISDLKLPSGVNPAGDYAYDITTGMSDGNFEYDVTLPKSEDQNANVSYIEKSADEVKNQSETLKTNDIKPIDEGKLNQDGDKVVASGIDHFTIWIVGKSLSLTGSLNKWSQIVVSPNEIIKVTLEVGTSGSSHDDDWESSQYRIEGGSWTCVDTANHNNDGSYTETFNIAAPSNVGTYDISFRAYNNESCVGSVSSSSTLTDGIIVSSCPVGALFCDDFESNLSKWETLTGNFYTNDSSSFRRSCPGDFSSCAADGHNHYSAVSNDGSLIKNISTTGFGDVILSYWRRADDLESGDNDNLQVSWRIGSSGSWTILESTRNNSWSKQTWTLVGSGDKSNIQIKIGLVASSDHDYALFDDVLVLGSVLPVCGDGIKNGSEECDGTDGVTEGLVCNERCELGYIERKVDICHSTSSQTNPYNLESPNKSADVSGHDGHNGPIWHTGITSSWGDIIPPFNYIGGSYLGKNWTSEGRAIYQAGCHIDICGNGSIETGEQCDDSNTTNGDGCSSTCQTETPTCPNLFFSEYIEGTSTNKALEIYNPTGSSVNLSSYSIVRYTNGASSPSNTYSLTGTLASSDVYVVCNNGIDSSQNSKCDVKISGTDTIVSFNGNDAVALRKNGIIIDVIGKIGQDPVEEWGGGLTSTKDNTLVRKCSLTCGDFNGADDFNPATEWDGYATNTFSYLGSHTLSCATCGDGVVNQTSELCDDGLQNGQVCTPLYGGSCNYCSVSCQTVTVTGSYCGDNIKNDSEQCDDGNTNNNDTCNNQCQYNPVKIKAYKVICDSEADLPNQTQGVINQNTAQNWVNSHSGCRLEDQWTFQYAGAGAGSFGAFQTDTSTLQPPWNTFEVVNDAVINDLSNFGGRIEVREIIPDNVQPMIGFSNDNSNNVSAEIYCTGDAAGYDNWEWIINPQYGQTYYCVAFNALNKGTITIHKNVESANNADASVQFHFDITKQGDSNPTAEVNVSENSPQTVEVSAGTYSINEVIPDSIKDAWIQRSASCTKESDPGHYIYDLSSLVVNPGDKIDCIQGNSKKAEVLWYKIDSNLGPDDSVGGHILGSDTWESTLNGEIGPKNTNSADPYHSPGTYTNMYVNPGEYSLQEVGQTGWSFAWGRCQDMTNAVASGWGSNIDIDQTQEGMQQTFGPKAPNFVSGYGVLGTSSNNYADINLSAGQRVYCVLYNEQIGSILAHKFEDVNGNGSIDSNEGGLSGWEMGVYNGFGCTGQVISNGTKNTDVNGDAQFDNLVVGNYSVKETEQTDWQRTTTECRNVTVNPGEITTVNIGNRQLFPNLTITKTVADSIINKNTEAEFTLTASNSGETVARGTIITDNLPDGFSYVLGSTTGANEPTINGQTLTWGLFDISVGGQVVLTFRATAPNKLVETENCAEVLARNSQNERSVSSCTNIKTEAPAISIAKSNNTTGKISLGAIVTYTIKVTNTNQNVSLYKTKVLDAHPFKAAYIAGSATAISNIHNPFITTEPSCNDYICNWTLGTLSEGETVTLTYQLKINSAPLTGKYWNIAFANGHDSPNSNIVNSEIVESPIEIDKTLAYSTNVKPGETSVLGASTGPAVLGASTELPGTGANFGLTLFELLALIGALVLRKKLMKKAKHLKIKVLTLLFAFILISLSWKSVNAVEEVTPTPADSVCKIDISSLSPLINVNNITLSYVTLDTNSEASLSKIVFSYRKDGDSNQTLTFSTSNPSGEQIINIDGQGNYFFSAEAHYDNSDVCNSVETSTTIDTTGPNPLDSFGFSRKDGSSTAYEICFKTPGDVDVASVKIYRSDKEEFTADSSSEIHTEDIDSATNRCWVNDGLESGKTFYYAGRVIDNAGNASNPSYFNKIVVEENPNVSSGITNQGGLAINNVVTSGNGSVLGESSDKVTVTPTKAQNKKEETINNGQVLGESQKPKTKSSPILLIIGGIVLIVIIVYFLFRKKQE